VKLIPISDQPLPARLSGFSHRNHDHNLKREKERNEFFPERNIKEKVRKRENGFGLCWIQNNLIIKGPNQKNNKTD